MDNRSSLSQNALVIAGSAGVAFVIGLIIGLVVLGWWLWPVRWINASPANLHPDFQRQYLTMAIEAYSINPDAKAAKERFAALGENGKALLQEIAQKPPEGINPSTISSFANAIGVEVAGLPPVPAGEGTGQQGNGAKPTQAATGVATPTAAAGLEDMKLTPTSAPTATEAPQRSHTTLRLISFLCAFSLFALLLAAGLFYWRSTRKPKAPVTAAQRAQAMTQSAESTDYTAEGREPPLSQFMTTYVHGDDLFDDSFSIDAPNGDFLGECGVGITETIGVGEPKRVMAFEVWLFDKNDIKTVTKVLMSEHAYNDEETRKRLASKGDPVMAEQGKEIVLETERLQLIARVVDMAYGEDALPSKSYFERLTLELAVWPKE